MALERYRQKRNFKLTPEPPGKVKRHKLQNLAFVVQKHAATRLHYDFRLELNGVFLSWAVPKGPSLDPNDKRLAVHVEDHPLEYGDFEGVIPAKQYGAGTVMVWDRGTWKPKTDPAEAYAKGRLKFELDGEKLNGGWNLVRSHGSKYGEKSWLLIKEADEFARLGSDALVTEDRPESALTGRTMEQIAAEADRVWHSNKSVADNLKGGAAGKRKLKPKIKLDSVKGARKAPFPRRIDVQLATLVKSPPEGPAWVHEIKYDGYRMLCSIANGEAHLMSRNGKDWTDAFAALARTLASLPVDSACLDGEVVVVDAKGRTSFQALQNAIGPTASARSLSYFAFDLLYLNGYDLRGVALTQRKRILQELLASAPPSVKYSEHFAAPGAAFFKNVCDLGLEGMVSKRGDLPYQAGRGTAWQKAKCLQRQEMVVGGFTDPEGSRHGFGALLLGVYDPDGRLAYAGKVGTGFNDATLSALSRTLAGIKQKQSPFSNPPTGAEGRRAHWVKPKLVAEVAFTEWTDDGTLRHPSFLGLRSDKPATEVVRERAVSVSGDNPADPPPSKTAARAATRARSDPNAIAGITLTNPDKALYPEAKISKRDLALYYAAVGERMLPHLIDRPLTLYRCPNGWGKGCFYQKKAEDSVSAAITRVRVTGGDGTTANYMMANSLSAIVALVQMGVLELHPWGSRAKHLGRPDWIIFDLDPADDVAWEDVKQAALLVKALLENIGFEPFLKTTGGKGLHVVIAIEPSVGWDEVKGFTKAVAELLQRTFPDRFTANLMKVSRHGKVFIDYLRNSEGATAIAPYSTRARANAPVSTPLAWDELSRDVRFAHFHVGNVPKRLAKLKADPWRDLDKKATSLTKAVMARVGFKPR
ncbi:MAG TPA: DNA ligase D [Casimicrobiaceae bacterium]|nr:DNA ligase D [Casimicrobiaceae bacterium]